MGRIRFKLIPGRPYPPAEVEQRIVEHLGRRTAIKSTRDWIEIASTSMSGMTASFSVARRLRELLDEAEPAWRSYYTFQPMWLTREGQRWLGATTLAAARAQAIANDPSRPASERAEAEKIVAEAKEEADKVGLLPSLTRSLATSGLESLAKAELDDEGWIVLPIGVSGQRLRTNGL